MTKRCSKCGEDKTLDQFIKDKRYKLGRFCWCNACRKIAYIKWLDKLDARDREHVSKSA